MKGRASGADEEKIYIDTRYRHHYIQRVTYGMKIHIYTLNKITQCDKKIADTEHTHSTPN